MPAAPSHQTLSLADYLGLFQALADQGAQSVIIGDCAVGVYGRVVAEPVLSADLDLYVERRTLDLILERVSARGARIRKRPVPRRLEVAVFDWEGKEVNLLTATHGLPSPDIEVRVAREFHLPGRPDLAILVADPYDLLANKLAIARAKDAPHIAILRRFIDEEIVAAFEHESDPRKRIAPAQRLLRITRARTLDEPLAARMIPLATTPADFRFLMNHLPTWANAESLLARCEDESLREELTAIRARRRLREV